MHAGFLDFLRKRELKISVLYFKPGEKDLNNAVKLTIFERLSLTLEVMLSPVNVMLIISRKITSIFEFFSSNP